MCLRQLCTLQWIWYHTRCSLSLLDTGTAQKNEENKKNTKLRITKTAETKHKNTKNKIEEIKETHNMNTNKRRMKNDAFNFQVVHWIIQLTLLTTLHCRLHRCPSPDQRTCFSRTPKHNPDTKHPTRPPTTQPPNTPPTTQPPNTQPPNTQPVAWYGHSLLFEWNKMKLISNSNDSQKWEKAKTSWDSFGQLRLGSVQLNGGPSSWCCFLFCLPFGPVFFFFQKKKKTVVQKAQEEKHHDPKEGKEGSTAEKEKATTTHRRRRPNSTTKQKRRENSPEEKDRGKATPPQRKSMPSSTTEQETKEKQPHPKHNLKWEEAKQHHPAWTWISRGHWNQCEGTSIRAAWNVGSVLERKYLRFRQARMFACPTPQRQGTLWQLLWISKSRGIFRNWKETQQSSKKQIRIHKLLN